MTLTAEQLDVRQQTRKIFPVHLVSYVKYYPAVLYSIKFQLTAYLAPKTMKSSFSLILTVWFGH